MDTKSAQGSLQGPISPTLYRSFELSQKQSDLSRSLE
jgi:hypothetical protein